MSYQIESHHKNGQLHPCLVKLLQKREYESEEQIQTFLSWDLKDLPNLTNLIDLKKASQRIIEAIEKKEKIGIYGDYDVDGTTSCALFWHFFHMLGIETELFQPSRFIEGYGVHPSSIDAACEKGVSVLITVDCGITSTETACYARNKLDLIITDHHKDAAPEIPDAFAVINPSRRDEDENSPLKPLAGVGVAFALCLQIRNDLMSKGRNVDSIYPLLQFVAIGTISDLAKMTPLNLKLTRHGLKQIPTTTFPGISTFFKEDDLKSSFIPSEKISFHVGPHINSKGRLDHPERALKMLISQSQSSAQEHFNHLKEANNERKFIQAQVFNEAKKEVLFQLNKNEEKFIHILYKEDWHEGVIGIVASRIVETFSVPAIIFTNAEEEGVIKASCRTAGELNMFELLHQCRDLFLKFGGHKAAAGLSMKRENLPELKTRMNKLLKEIPPIIRTKQNSFDLEIGIEDITPQLVRQLHLLEPYGPGNERPIFRMKNAVIKSFKIMKDLHVRWFFTDLKSRIHLQGVSFHYIGKWNELSPEEIFDLQDHSGITVQFTLGINRFNGNESIQLMVDHIYAGKIH